VRVVVLGAGSLGSLYAAWCADAGHDVVVVARPAHAAAIGAAGLLVRDLDGHERTVPLGAVADAADAPDADVVVLASKAPDTASLLDRYRGTPTAAWSIQNGALQAEPLIERFGAAGIGCVSMVGGTLAAPGVVHHTFAGCTYLGPMWSSSLTAVEVAVASLPADAGVVVREDIASVLWSKAVLAAAAMGMSVLLRTPYHRVFTDPAAREVFLSIVADAAAIATAEGAHLVDLPGPLQAGTLVALPRPEALARLAAVGAAMVAAGPTEVRVSMLQSLESGRRLEVDAVFGSLVDRADRHGLAVPVLRAVTNVVTALDRLAGTGTVDPIPSTSGDAR
jgi:2-dehydropantoate 2-reductase